MAKPNKYRVAFEARLNKQRIRVDDFRQAREIAQRDFDHELAILHELEAIGRAVEDGFSGQDSNSKVATIATQIVSLDTKPRRQRRKKLRVGDGDAPALASHLQPVPGSNSDLPSSDNIEAGDAQPFPEIPDNLRRVPRRQETESDNA